MIIKCIFGPHDRRWSLLTTKGHKQVVKGRATNVTRDIPCTRHGTHMMIEDRVFFDRNNKPITTYNISYESSLVSEIMVKTGLK